MKGEVVLTGSGGIVAPSANQSLTRSLRLVALFVVFQALDGFGLEGTTVELAGEILVSFLHVEFLSLHSNVVVLSFDIG